MKKNIVFLSILVFNCAILFSQNDTTIHKLNPVEVKIKKEIKQAASSIPIQVINSEQLSSMPAIQLSDAVKFFSGLVVKDYGGVGGIKTVSVRGFGAQHTAVVYDGLALTDCQTGQVDIGKFSLNNIEQISLNSGTPDDIFIPARFMASASTIRINTKRGDLTKIPFHISANFKGGSYTFLNPSIFIENRLRKRKKENAPLISSSFYFDYLYSKGDYPFILHYGGANDSTSSEYRSNSEVCSFLTEANLYVDFTPHSHLNFKIYYYNAKRGLPGAVIFYNLTSCQKLWDENTFAQVEYENHFNRKFSYAFHGKFNYAYQRYIDPEYLNWAHFLDNRYIQREGYFSNLLRYSPNKIIALSLSNDFIYNNMTSNIVNFVYPERFTFLTALSSYVNYKFLTLTASLLNTCIINQVKMGEGGKDLTKFSPSLSFSFKPLQKENLYIKLFYKNIFRLPTFNDLYYRNVGNITLNPENTNQINLGIAYQDRYPASQIAFSFSVDGYYNNVRDKIICIPNKNLFLWSMINYGKVNMVGVDCNFSFNYPIIKQLTIELSGNYSYQYDVDMTDLSEKTYLHQIPYTPRHSGTGLFAVKTPWIYIIYTIQVVGKRYALLENIPSNELAPYTDQSISLSKDFTIKGHRFGIRFELLNLADTQYEVIRYYPMQGRSFRVEVRYHF